MNIGPVEIVIVLALALLVFGPKRLPQMGRTLGRGVREFRKASDDIKGSLTFDDEHEEDSREDAGASPAAPDASPKPAADARTEPDEAAQERTAPAAGSDVA